jgi:hypothetical protein
MTATDPPARPEGSGARRALVVRGGWDGHVPVEASDRYVRVLKETGFEVTVSDSLDGYLDEALMSARSRTSRCPRWIR